jgi:hypothetical protein
MGERRAHRVRENKTREQMFSGLPRKPTSDLRVNE